jgi:hypothetical protein
MLVSHDQKLSERDSERTAAMIDRRSALRADTVSPW